MENIDIIGLGEFRRIYIQKIEICIKKEKIVQNSQIKLKVIINVSCNIDNLFVEDVFGWGGVVWRFVYDEFLKY